MYKPAGTIFFLIIIVFGVRMFDITQAPDNAWLVKLLNGEGVYTEPIAYFNTALAIKINDTDALNNKGSDLSDLGNDAEAIEYYDRALAIDPDHVDSLYDKARSLNRLGNITGAIEYYDRALAIDPDHTDAMNNKGNIFRTFGNYTEAIKSYDKALVVEPNHTLALTNKGIALNDLGRPNQAIVYFDKALAIEPNSTFTLFNKGKSLYSLGNNTGATEYYDRVLVIEPNHEEALAFKGLISNTASSDSLTYQHPDLGFIVEYPTDAEVKENGDGVEFLIEEGSVLINIRQLSEEQTLEEFTDERISSLQESFDNVSLAKPTTTTLSGHPASNLIFNFDSFDYPSKRMLGWLVTNVINGTTAVQLLFTTTTATGNETKLPPYDFINMLDTFDLSGQPEEIMDGLSQQNGIDVDTNLTGISQPSSAELLSPENFSVSSKLNFNTYENPEYGISIQYPESWRVSENGLTHYTQIVAFYAPLESLLDTISIPAQLIVSRIDFSHNITQSEYTALMLDQTTQSLGINASISDAVLSHKPGHQLIITSPADQLKPETGLLQVWSVKDNTVYNIIYMADTTKFPEYLQVVQNMIESFQVDHWIEP